MGETDLFIRWVALLEETRNVLVPRSGHQDLSANEIRLLAVLVCFADASGAELARHVGAAPSAVTARLRSLTRKGLVETRPDPMDARIRRHRLTQDGRRRLQGVVVSRLSRS